ncbi:MAG: hypothetical protein ABR584_09530 [Candidatus Baltobacteraceae bacterium]
METHFGRRARALPLSGEQRNLILGSVLGDGYLMRTTSGNCLRINHGVGQSIYVDWKYLRLREFVRTAPRQSGKTYYFRTVTHPELTELASSFYCGERKGLPSLEPFEQWISALTLAVWFMDDGARDGNQVRLNSQCFSVAEVAKLQDMLFARFQIRSTLNSDKGRPRIRIAASSMDVFRQHVRPHILPEFLYKLP